MGLLSNDKLLKEISKYLDNTDFTNQEIGHRLALTFVPPHIETKVEDKRYSFQFKHKLLNLTFTNVTYGGLIVELVVKLNAELREDQNLTFREFYEEVGLIEDNRCTKELISTVVANGIAIHPTVKKGNHTNNIRRSDNLQNIFSEFSEQSVSYFLNEVDNYKPVN